MPDTLLFDFNSQSATSLPIEFPSMLDLKILSSMFDVTLLLCQFVYPSLQSFLTGSSAPLYLHLITETDPHSHLCIWYIGPIKTPTTAGIYFRLGLHEQSILEREASESAKWGHCTWPPLSSRTARRPRSYDELWRFVMWMAIPDPFMVIGQEWYRIALENMVLEGPGFLN